MSFKYLKSEDLTTPEKQFCFQLEIFSKSLYEHDWPSHPHTHAYLEFIFCASGIGNLYIEDEVLKISKNDFFVINKNAIHRETSSEENPLELYYLGFENLDFKLNQNFFPLKQICFTIQPEILFPLIYQEFEEKKQDYQTVLFSLFNLLIADVSRNINPAQYVSNPHISKIYKIINYIDENYNRPITLSSMAKRIPISIPQLIRLFKKEKNTTPLQYLLLKRLHAAKILLKTSDCSIENITSIVGFSSTSNFIEKFKALEKITPTEYRNKYSSL